MSYKTQQASWCPSPPIQSSRKVTYESSPSCISPLSARRRFDHAIPIGTVASRVKHLQSLRNTPILQQAHSISRDSDDHFRRASLGRRLSSRFAQPASRSSKPDDEPLVNYSHSYMGQRTSRSNYQEEHAIADGNRSYERIGSGNHSSIEPRGTVERVQYNATSPWAVPEKRKLSEYNRALRDYSRKEMEKITETEAHNVHTHLPSQSDFVEDCEQAASHNSNPEASRKMDCASVDTTSTHRHEDVRDLFKQYGISRPAGLVSSSEQTPDHSVLGDSCPTESKNHNIAPPSQTPIADSFMQEKQKQHHLPVPSQKPKGEHRYHPQHMSRRASATTQSPKPRSEQKLAKSEVVRHQKAKEIHVRKQLTPPPKYTPKAAEHPRHEISYAEDMSDHLSTPIKHNTKEHMYTRPSARPVRKHSNPYSGDDDSEHLWHAKTHEELIQKQASTLEHLIPESSCEKRNQMQTTSPLMHDKVQFKYQEITGDHYSSRSRAHPEPHAEHQMQEMPHAQHVQMRNSVKSEHQRTATAHDASQPNPQPENHAQHIQKLATPPPTRSWSVPGRHEEDIMAALSVPEHSVRDTRKGHRSQYFTTPEQRVSIGSGSHPSTTDEEFSLLVTSSPILRFLPVELVPSRHHSPKHHSRHSRRSGHHHGSPSSSISCDSPVSSCGTPTCRATHSGHAPYRHSISCTEKRHQRHVDEDTVYPTGMSYTEEADHSLVRRRNSREPHIPKHVKHHRHLDYSSHESFSSSIAAEQCRRCSGYVDRCHHCPDDNQCDLCRIAHQSAHRYTCIERDSDHISTVHHHHSLRTAPATSPEQALLRSGCSSPRSVLLSQTSTPHLVATPTSPVILPTLPKQESSYEEHYAATGHQHLPNPPARAQSSRRAESSALSRMSTPPFVISASGPILSPMPRRKNSSPRWTHASFNETSQETHIQPPKVQEASYTPQPNSDTANDKYDQPSELESKLQAPPHQENTKAPTVRHVHISPTAIQATVKHQGPSIEIKVVESPEEQTDKPSSIQRQSVSNAGTSTVRRHPKQVSKPSSPTIEGLPRRTRIHRLPTIHTIVSQPRKSESRVPNLPRLVAHQKAANPPSSKLPLPKYRSASSLAVPSVLDSPSVYTTSVESASPVTSKPSYPKIPKMQKKTLDIPKSSIMEQVTKFSSNSPKIPQRRSFRPPQLSTRPHTSMEEVHRSPPPALRPHTSKDSRSRTPCPGTPSTRTTSTATGRPRTPVHKITPKRLTPPDVREGDEKSMSRNISKKISTLFQLKERKSIPLLNHKLQEQLEEQKNKTTEDGRKEKKPEKQKSKGLKFRDVGEAPRRKWSLELKGSKDSKSYINLQQHALIEEDADSMAIQHSDILEGGRHDGQMAEQKVVQQFEVDIEGGEEVFISSQESDGTQDWSRSGKGQVSSTPESEKWTLRMVGNDTLWNGVKADQHDSSSGKEGKVLSPAKQKSTLNINPQGFVSSKVQEWDRELAMFKEGSPKLVWRDAATERAVPLPKTKQELRTSKDTAYHTAPSKTRPPNEGLEGLSLRSVEEPAEAQRRNETLSLVGFGHDCVWKSMFLSQRKQGVKISMERLEFKDESKKADKVAREYVTKEEKSDVEDCGILGITVLVHRRGKEDFVVRTDLEG